MRITGSLGGPSRGVEELRDAGAGRCAGGGDERGLEREGAGDAVGLAGLEREEQVARLEVGAADMVDHPEAERRLLAYYPPEKVNPARMKMAETPEGAELIDNPVSV